MAVTAEYKAGVREAWVGEIYGEAVFDELARLAEGTEVAATWSLLAELERVTGRQVAPLVMRYGYDLTPPEEEKARGRDNASNLAHMPPLDFVAMMEPYLEEVVAKYQALRDEAPPEDAEAMQFLVDHEAALLRFAQIERSGSGGDSTKAVRDLVAKAATPH